MIDQYDESRIAKVRFANYPYNMVKKEIYFIEKTNNPELTSDIEELAVTKIYPKSYLEIDWAVLKNLKVLSVKENLITCNDVDFVQVLNLLPRSLEKISLSYVNPTLFLESPLWAEFKNLIHLEFFVDKDGFQILQQSKSPNKFHQKYGKVNLRIHYPKSSAEWIDFSGSDGWVKVEKEHYQGYRYD